MNESTVSKGYIPTANFLTETAGRALHELAPHCPGPINFTARPILYDTTNVYESPDFLTVLQQYGLDFIIIPPLFV
jgi:hypothetical protein